MSRLSIISSVSLRFRHVGTCVIRIRVLTNVEVYVAMKISLCMDITLP